MYTKIYRRDEYLRKWKNKGVVVKVNGFQRKEFAIKLFNRNCISGKKYKFYATFLKSLKLIHIFLFFYGRFTKSLNFWRINNHLQLNLDDFFFYNSPYLALRKKIVKRMPNRFALYYIERHRRPAEVFKWFFTLSYKQPFNKAYQRCAFLMLDFIFFEKNNIFKELIKIIGIQKFNQFYGVETKGNKKKKVLSKFNKNYVGIIKNV